MLLIFCSPSYDGGIKQSFNLEVLILISRFELSSFLIIYCLKQIFDSKSKKLRLNLTSSTRPEFNLANFHTDHTLQLEIYSWNQVGQSEKIVIGNVKVNASAKHVGKNEGFSHS